MRLGDVTDIYEQHEVDEHLAADAAKLEAFVRTAEKEMLKLEERHA